MASASSCPGCGGHLRLEDAQGGLRCRFREQDAFPSVNPGLTGKWEVTG